MSMDGVRQKWDTCDMDTTRSVSWLSTPFFSEFAVMRFMGKGMCGGFVESLHQLLAKRLGGNTDVPLRGLALVCGDMAGERLYFQSSVLTFGEVDGIDISEKSLEKAVSNCAPYAFRFNPVNADCNTIRVEESRYDFIVGNHGIHHVKNLEHVFSQIEHGLKPQGLLFANEYVGPNFIQVPLRNRVIAALLVNLLVYPPQRRITHEKKWKLIIRNLHHWVTDPSEAVRSEDILKTAAKHLDILKLHEYGGLNYPAFEGLGQHFSDSERDKRLLRAFSILEDLLTRVHAVRPLFCYLLAAKRKP